MGEFLFKHVNFEFQSFVVAFEGEELLLGGDQDLLEGGIRGLKVGSSGRGNDL